MADLKLYTNPMSRGRIARWMLEETGQPYDAVVLNYGPEMKSPDYLALNPMGKVPTLLHGDLVVTEGAAICAYLADAFPDAGLAPDPRSPERGTYYRWLCFGAGPMEAAVTNASLGVKTDTPELMGRVGYGSLASVVNALDGWLSGRDYILGERFSAADVYVGSQVTWGLMFGTMERRTSLEAYAARLGERPAAQRARAADDALMPKPES